MALADYTCELIPRFYSQDDPPPPYTIRQGSVFFGYTDADPPPTYALQEGQFVSDRPGVSGVPRMIGHRPDLYWVHNGLVFTSTRVIKGADLESFRYYLGGFARDRRHCYLNWSRLKGGDPATFRALNGIYATDGQLVWAVGVGLVQDVDPATFEICDDGMNPRLRVPTGFAKDQDRVIYYDYVGKPKWVRKAAPESFVSLNDGYFGKDRNLVFYTTLPLPRANVARWRVLDGLYSRDDERIYCGNQQLASVDLDSFQIISSWLQPLARDKNRFFWASQAVDQAKFEELQANTTRGS